MSKNYDGWCIKAPDGKLYNYAFRETRLEALGFWCLTYRGWQRLYRQGYRCVKVRLVEVTP